jgi:hypothetical protein
LNYRHSDNQAEDRHQHSARVFHPCHPTASFLCFFPRGH